MLIHYKIYHNCSSKEIIPELILACFTLLPFLGGGGGGSIIENQNYRKVNFSMFYASFSVGRGIFLGKEPKHY
jgi:hypothetical protein